MPRRRKGHTRAARSAPAAAPHAHARASHAALFCLYAHATRTRALPHAHPPHPLHPHTHTRTTPTAPHRCYAHTCTPTPRHTARCTTHHTHLTPRTLLHRTRTQPLPHYTLTPHRPPYTPYAPTHTRSLVGCCVPHLYTARHTRYGTAPASAYGFTLPFARLPAGLHAMERYLGTKGKNLISIPGLPSSLNG